MDAIPSVTSSDQITDIQITDTDTTRRRLSKRRRQLLDTIQSLPLPSAVTRRLQIATTPGVKLSFKLLLIMVHQLVKFKFKLNLN